MIKKEDILKLVDNISKEHLFDKEAFFPLIQNEIELPLYYSKIVYQKSYYFYLYILVLPKSNQYLLGATEPVDSPDDLFYIDQLKLNLIEYDKHGLVKLVIIKSKEDKIKEDIDKELFLKLFQEFDFTEVIEKLEENKDNELYFLFLNIVGSTNSLELLDTKDKIDKVLEIYKEKLIKYVSIEEYKSNPDLKDGTVVYKIQKASKYVNEDTFMSTDDFSDLLRFIF